MRAILEKIPLIRGYIYNNPLRIILIAGIALRIIVFLFQSPFNKDDHFQIVSYIYNHRTIPISNQFMQSYHPPLYYILASLFRLGGAKIVQILSLVLSIGTISVIYWLIKNSEIIQSLKIKKYCLLLACLLPQFIMFGNYISNDTLSFFIGSLIFLQMYLYIHKPTIPKLIILAIYLGLGLLTKGSFLSFIPVLILFVAITNFKDKLGFKRRIFYLLIFITFFLTLGSYKYLENIIHHHRPIVHNLDSNPPWANDQRPTYVNLKTFVFDINILKLCKYPTYSEYTRHSLPLLLYGTFWYQYFRESNFKGNRTKSKYLGSCIYLLALLPTSLFFIGFFRILFSIKYIFHYKYKELDEQNFNKIIYEASSLLLLLMNLALVIIAGIKYDVFSCYQARLLFPSFFAIIILFNSGLDFLEKRMQVFKKKAYLLLRCLFLLFILYFCIEIIGQGIMLLPTNIEGIFRELLL